MPVGRFHHVHLFLPLLLQLGLHLVHLLMMLSYSPLHTLSFYLLLELLKSFMVELDPLAGVAHGGVLQQSSEHHEEAHGQVDVQGFHVGDFWKGHKNKQITTRCRSRFYKKYSDNVWLGPKD